jgi:hypothetical protein
MDALEVLMRRYHRILAMLLAIVTVWTILPMGVLADTWAEVETEKKAFPVPT